MTYAPSHGTTGAGPAAMGGARRRARPPARRRSYSPERRRRADARRRRLRGLLRLAVLIAVVVIAVWASAHVANAANDAGRYSERTYTVRGGDTLWGIAGRMYGKEPDPRQVVHAIESANHLPGAQIAPGQVLVLPPEQSL